MWLLIEDLIETYQNAYILIKIFIDSKLYTNLCKVDPDSDGNNWGIYGCLLHQHPLPRKNKSDIIFENKTAAEEFFKQHLKPMYSLGGIHRKKSEEKVSYVSYTCRRPKIASGRERFSIHVEITEYVHR